MKLSDLVVWICESPQESDWLEGTHAIPDADVKSPPPTADDTDLQLFADNNQGLNASQPENDHANDNKPDRTISEMPDDNDNKPHTGKADLSHFAYDPKHDYHKNMKNRRISK